MCSAWRALHDEELHTLSVRFECVGLLSTLVPRRFPNVCAPRPRFVWSV